MYWEYMKPTPMYFAFITKHPSYNINTWANYPSYIILSPNSHAEKGICVK